MSITLVGDNLRYTIPSVNNYSDDTPMVKVGYENISDLAKDTDTIVVKYNTLDEFMKAMFLADAMNSLSNNYYNLVLPYVPGARQDRINPTGDVLFTAKSIANIINRGPFTNVVILDPHSKVIENLIEEVVVYSLKNVAKRITKQYDFIIGPDKGAIDRAIEFDNILHTIDVIEGIKVRDVSTGALTGFDIKVKQGKHYLMVDDICDGGGTFIGLNKKIREQGATADLYVTHGIFSKGIGELSQNFGNIITTDSLHETPMSSNVEVINIVDDMVKFIREQ